MPTLIEPETRFDETNRSLLKDHMRKQDVLKFDWESKWLKGEEYFYVLANMARYRRTLDL